jgi:hypothetical protein
MPTDKWQPWIGVIASTPFAKRQIVPRISPVINDHRNLTPRFAMLS